MTPSPVLSVIAGSAIAFIAVRASADNGEVPPPTPSAQTPQAVTKQPPAVEAVKAPTPQAPQQITISVVPQQAPPVQAQQVTLRLSADQSPAPVVPPVQPVAAAPAPTVQAEVKQAGPLGRLVGAVGEKLARAGYDRILVPRQAPTAQAVVVPVQYQVQTAAPAVQAVQVQPSAQQQTQAIMVAAPAAAAPAKKCRLFGR